MDISSTTSQVSASAETTTSSQAQKTSSKGDTSFKDEMNKVSADDKSTGTDAKTETETNEKKSSADTKQAENETVAVKTENLDNDIIKASIEREYEHPSDLSKSVLISGEAFALNSQTDVNSQTQAILDVNMMLSEVSSATKAIPVKVDYSVIQMDMNDTQFFADLVQNQDKTLQNVVTELTQNREADVQEIQKNIKVSATLMNALSEAVKNKQSFRIDFDKDISVIIKVDRDGAITARFIPGDSAVEQYLKQNISTLRQRFDDQELAYNELSYTGQQKRERRNNNNKENGHE